MQLHRTTIPISSRQNLTRKFLMCHRSGQRSRKASRRKGRLARTDTQINRLDCFPPREQYLMNSLSSLSTEACKQKKRVASNLSSQIKIRICSSEMSRLRPTQSPSRRPRRTKKRRRTRRKATTSEGSEHK